MIWEHTGRMHWTSKDVTGVVMVVCKTTDDSWTFLATDVNTGTNISIENKLAHPMHAIQLGNKLKELYSVEQEEKGRSKSSTPATEETGSVQPDHS